jgi:hypothetical protein
LLSPSHAYRGTLNATASLSDLLTVGSPLKHRCTPQCGKSCTNVPPSDGLQQSNEWQWIDERHSKSNHSFTSAATCPDAILVVTKCGSRCYSSRRLGSCLVGAASSAPSSVKILLMYLLFFVVDFFGASSSLPVHLC